MPCIPFKMGNTRGVICTRTVYEAVTETGRRYSFEFGPFTGPVVVSRRTGEPLDRQPGRRSSFWPAFEKWWDESYRSKRGAAYG